jgi:hypothetical protein
LAVTPQRKDADRLAKLAARGSGVNLCVSVPLW